MLQTAEMLKMSIPLLHVKTKVLETAEMLKMLKCYMFSEPLGPQHKNI